MSEYEAMWTKKKLAARFSEHELRLAAVVWGLVEDRVLSEQIEKEMVSDDAIKELLKNIKKCLHRTNRGCRRSRRLTDYLD